jgi:pilus assembly protein Flp/PilA
MMNILAGLMLRLKNDRRGVTALEYGLIASLIAVVIISGVTAVGQNAEATFQSIATAM